MGRNPRGDVGLEYLSVFGMPLPQYVALAARLRCDFVSVNYRGAANRLVGPADEPLKDSKSARRQLATALADHGMRLELVEGFAIEAGTTVEDYASDLDVVAQLGARSLCVVSLDKDRARTHAQFARLAELAAERRLIVTTEVGAGVLRTIQQAKASWLGVGHPNFKLLIDTMHYFRRGGMVNDLGRLPPEAIGHVQICDVPMPARIESYMEEALFERQCPGDGDLPLADFLAWIPTSTAIGIEAPIRSASNELESSLLKCLTRIRHLVGPGLFDQEARG